MLPTRANPSGSRKRSLMVSLLEEERPPRITRISTNKTEEVGQVRGLFPVCFSIPSSVCIRGDSCYSWWFLFLTVERFADLLEQFLDDVVRRHAVALGPEAGRQAMAQHRGGHVADVL